MPHGACRWQQTPSVACGGCGMLRAGAQPGLWGAVDGMNWVRWGRGGLLQSACAACPWKDVPSGASVPVARLLVLTLSYHLWEAELDLGNSQHTELPPHECQTLCMPPHPRNPHDNSASWLSLSSLYDKE